MRSISDMELLKIKPGSGPGVTCTAGVWTPLPIMHLVRGSLTSSSCSWDVSVLMIRIHLDLEVSRPTSRRGSLHHGSPMSVSQSERGSSGGTCRNRPLGVQNLTQPVRGSTHLRTWGRRRTGFYRSWIRFISFDCPEQAPPTNKEEDQNS